MLQAAPIGRFSQIDIPIEYGSSPVEQPALQIRNERELSSCLRVAISVSTRWRRAKRAHEVCSRVQLVGDDMLLDEPGKFFRRAVNQDACVLLQNEPNLADLAIENYSRRQCAMRTHCDSSRRNNNLSPGPRYRRLGMQTRLLRRV